ncbi:MAG: FixH family protein [Candidatus Schekmanbacteria bacterium]|nr:FixH family protein [Candidatus Schekmanbacteria bacterium]
MKAAWVWPAIIVTLLAAHCSVTGFLLVAATTDPSFAVEDRYYEKALSWDAELAQRKRNDELGWRLLVQPPGGLAGLETQEVPLVVRLTDRSGAPIQQAEVTVAAFHNARAAQVTTRALRERAPGQYEALFPFVRAGIWELRCAATSRGQVFTRVVRATLPGTGDSV